MSGASWRKDTLQIEANRRQRITEKFDELSNLVQWYNGGIITLSSMVRLLKSINFVPGPETIQVLECAPISVHELIRSLEKTYRAETKSTDHPSTNFIEAMMSPITPSRRASHRKDANSQIRLMFTDEFEPGCKISIPNHNHDHGDIIGWNDNPPEIKRRQIRRYTNRSNIISNGSVQPRATEKTSMRRHFDDAPTQYNWEQEAPKIQEDLQLRSPSHHQILQDLSPTNHSEYKIVVDPDYKGARAPFGTDADEAEALAKISPHYRLQAPFDTNLPNDGLIRTAPTKESRPSIIA